MTGVLICFTVQPWHDDWFLRALQLVYTDVCRSVMKSNRMSLRWCPERAHVFHTRDRVSTSVCVFVLKTAAINMAAACFLRCTAMLQLLIQLDCVYVCVFGRGTPRVIRGCKEGVSEAKRLTGGTAWTEPSPWDWTAVTEFMLTIRVLPCSWIRISPQGKYEHTLQEGHLWKYILLLQCIKTTHHSWHSTSHNFMPMKYFILTTFPICTVSEQRKHKMLQFSTSINQTKWITPGLRLECTGTYTTRLALFTEPQLLGWRDGRWIRV